RLAGGALSNRLADLSPGAVVEAQGPSGTFPLPRRNEFPIVLIAGGIGITPFMGYLESLTGSAQEPRVVLYYGCRNGATHAFASRLAELAARLPNLSVRTHFSRSREGDRCDGRARITAADISDELIRRRARIYLCGPEAMMDVLTKDLLARGVPGFEIFRERFRSPEAPVESNGSPRTVRFARSGRTMTWKPQSGTILSSAETIGIGIASGCRVGQCESCAVQVISGEVRHLTESPGALDGLCLTCQAIPMTDLVLDA
ncbi:MAG: 2Fe-2S iron-sulfur cluster binding domain-containing protein, partial [Hyphomicrobiales bacterium]|nr:2Fe-2S iron-sulfur cluster binding domain-containing protein [Hyphomicrobiales bacterium]